MPKDTAFVEILDEAFRCVGIKGPMHRPLALHVRADASIRVVGARRIVAIWHDPCMGLGSRLRPNPGGGRRRRDIFVRTINMRETR
jgi:hypothetical protein